MWNTVSHQVAIVEHVYPLAQKRNINYRIESKNGNITIDYQQWR